MGTAITKATSNHNPAVAMMVPTAAGLDMRIRRHTLSTIGSTKYAKPNAINNGTVTERMAYPA